MFKFASPAYLGLFLPLAAIIWRRGLGRLRPALRPTLRVVELGSATAGAGQDLLPPPTPWVRLAPFLDGTRYAVAALLILALAGPQWGQDVSTVVSQGVNIVLCVDLSESMAALDFKSGDKVLNRLQAVKGVVQEFVRGRESDRIGLVVFGSEAYTQLPLTRDYHAVTQALDRMDIGMAGKTTAMGDALGISIKRIKDVESKSNVLILLTDGRSNSGELPPESAAEIAARAGIKIYAIGVGGKAPAPFIVNDPRFGRRVAYIQADLDEEGLTALSEKTGGLYFRAENLEGLDRVSKTIDSLEKNEAKVKVYGEYEELYPWFALPAFLLLGIWVVLTNTRCLRAP
jgi:Ca-activated chloride channel family protein